MKHTSPAIVLWIYLYWVWKRTPYAILSCVLWRSNHKVVGSKTKEWLTKTRTHLTLPTSPASSYPSAVFNQLQLLYEFDYMVPDLARMPCSPPRAQDTPLSSSITTVRPDPLRELTILNFYCILWRCLLLLLSCVVTDKMFACLA